MEPRDLRGGGVALLVAASAMSPAGCPDSGPDGAPPGGGPPGTDGAPGGGVAPGAGGAPGGGVPGSCAPGGGKSGLPWGSRAGAIAVGGSWLPPEISAVFASGEVEGGGVAGSPPGSGSCGANTVAGSGTERSSSEPALVSVPAQGVVEASGADAAADSLPAAAGHGEASPAAATGAGGTGAAGAAGGTGAPGASGRSAPGEPPSEESTSAESVPEESAPDGSDPAAPPRLSPIPSLSAASCNHSGGVSRNEVWFRSTRCGGAGSASAAGSSWTPYSSSYRRITSPTGSEGHSVASPLSRAITRRCAPPSTRTPPARSSAQATKPRSNSRTRTSRCW